MSTTQNHAEALALVLKAKESYRSDARKLTWEEKIASIERMRKASRIARESGLKINVAAEGRERQSPAGLQRGNGV